MGLLDGKVALVTGAGRGVGRCYALALAAAGAHVVVNDLGGARDGTGAGTEPADAVARELRAAGAEAVANHDSVTDPAGCERMVGAAIAAWGRLDIVVNNAGILRDKTFAKMSEQEWALVLKVHLDGTRNVTRAALPELVRSGSGRLINTTSFSGLIGNYGQSNYGAAKAAIYGLTRVLALELRAKGVTANCVAPLAFTRMTEDIAMVGDELRPEQIAPLVVFLASELAATITGRVFGVQGQRIHLYEVQVNQGVTKAGTGLWRPEEIAAELTGIMSWSEPEATAVWPLGKRYKAAPQRIERADFQAYAQATDDPNPAYQGPTAAAPPMFHVVPFVELMGEMVRDPMLKMDLLRLVHAEHAMRFVGLLHDGDLLHTEGSLLAVEDKASGRLFSFDLRGYVGGELRLEGSTSVFIRGGERSAADKPSAQGEAFDPSSPRESSVGLYETELYLRPAPSCCRSDRSGLPHPQRREQAPAPTGASLPNAASVVIDQPIAHDQAQRYAQVSRDGNPIHTDPVAARAAGLPGPILHGLCTLALAARDLSGHFGAGDPSRLASLAVRFVGMVLPGSRLRLQAVEQQGEVHFRTLDASGELVLSQGRAVFRAAE